MSRKEISDRNRSNPISIFHKYINTIKIINKNPRKQTFNVVVKVEVVKVKDVKAIGNEKVDDFGYIRYLYNKISYIITYVNFRFSPHYRDKDHDFTVNIFEELPLNNILFVNLSKK